MSASWGYMTAGADILAGQTVQVDGLTGMLVPALPRQRLVSFRTDADRVREYGRCQVCGSPMDRYDVVKRLGTVDVPLILVACTGVQPGSEDRWFEHGARVRHAWQSPRPFVPHESPTEPD